MYEEVKEDNMAELVRVNTNITKEINEWLNERSKKTGYSKSMLIHLALDNYRNQIELFNELPNITKMMAAMQELEKRISLAKRLPSEADP